MTGQSKFYDDMWTAFGNGKQSYLRILTSVHKISVSNFSGEDETPDISETWEKFSGVERKSIDINTLLFQTSNIGNSVLHGRPSAEFGQRRLGSDVFDSMFTDGHKGTILFDDGPESYSVSDMPHPLIHEMSHAGGPMIHSAPKGEDAYRFVTAEDEPSELKLMQTLGEATGLGHTFRIADGSGEAETRHVSLKKLLGEGGIPYVFLAGQSGVSKSEVAEKLSAITMPNQDASIADSCDGQTQVNACGDAINPETGLPKVDIKNALKL